MPCSTCLQADFRDEPAAVGRAQQQLAAAGQVHVQVRRGTDVLTEVSCRGCQRALPGGRSGGARGGRACRARAAARSVSPGAVVVQERTAQNEVSDCCHDPRVVLLAGPVAAQQPPAAPPAQAPAPRRPRRPRRGRSRGGEVRVRQHPAHRHRVGEGKAANTRVKALNDKKVQELAEKNKQLQANQQKLQQSGAVLSDAARGQLEKDIEKIQVDIQRFTQDAQAEVQDLQQQLQLDFQRKLMRSSMPWPPTGAAHDLQPGRLGPRLADTALDVTAEVIKRFDAPPRRPRPRRRSRSPSNAVHSGGGHARGGRHLEVPARRGRRRVSPRRPRENRDEHGPRSSTASATGTPSFSRTR